MYCWVATIDCVIALFICKKKTRFFGGFSSFFKCQGNLVSLTMVTLWNEFFSWCTKFFSALHKITFFRPRFFYFLIVENYDDKFEVSVEIKLKIKITLFHCRQNKIPFKKNLSVKINFSQLIQVCMGKWDIFSLSGMLQNHLENVSYFFTECIQ